MPYQATVFNVMIASPTDVQVERDVARQVIHEWNAVHSDSREMLLQPLGWETHSHPSMDDRAQEVLNKQILNKADLLIAIFWTRLGSPTGEAVSGTVEEIMRHTEAGKPVMLYFSSAPVRLDSVDEAQYRALKKFKEQCKTSGLIENYDSPTDLRQKLSRQLAATIVKDRYFGIANENETDNISANFDRNVPDLSQEAQILLLDAVDDPHGRIHHVKYMGGTDMQTNGKQFIERGNPRSRAAWEGALEELASFGLVEDLGHGGTVFQITRDGYAMADLLRS